MSNRIKVRLEVYYANSFIKSLIEKKIPIYDIKQENNQLELVIDYDDYEVIHKMKTIKKIRIIKVYGIRGFVLYLKRYYYLLLFIIIGILINIFLSCLILTIQIDSSNQVLKEKISKDLREFGFSKYRFSFSYHELQILKEKILEKEKNSIEWLEIERIGTKYIIKVEEKKLSNEEEECLPRNIISKKNAMITRVEGVSGEVVKRKNEYVVPGEIVISGEIHNGEEVVSKRCAKGSIYGEVWYKVTLSIPMDSKETILKKESKIGFFCQIGSKKYFEKYDNYQLSFIPIFSSSIYPIKFGYAKYQKQIIKSYHYDLNTVEEVAYQKGEEYLNQKIDDYKVLRKKILKKTINNSKIIIEVFFSVEENIGEYQTIEESE